MLAPDHQNVAGGIAKDVAGEAAKFWRDGKHSTVGTDHQKVGGGRGKAARKKLVP
jgi:hypothetical protein